MSRLWSFAVLALLSACGASLPPPPPDAGPGPTPDAGRPLASLGGPLAAEGQLPSQLRVAVLWFPGIDTAALARPRAAETNPTALAQPLPARWQLDLFSEPPAEARGAFTTPGGGTGTRSVGAVVLFRDADGDGRLTLDAQGDSTDELVGSSAGVMPFDVDGPGLRYLLVWRSGTLGTDEADYALGFNLIRIDEAFATPEVRPLTTELTLTARADPRHALTFCEEAYASPEMSPEFACGQLVFRTPRVTSMIGSSEGVVFAGVQVLSGQRAIGNASVRINGVVVPSDGENGYVLVELFPVVVVQGVNRVRVDAPGLEPVVMEVALPTAPTFVTPAQNATVPVRGQLAVSWQGADLATSFDVSLTGDNGMADFVTTTQRQASLQAPEAAGPAKLRINASAERKRGRHLGLGIVEAERDVVVVSP